MAELMLDAAFPPTPSQLVADLNAVGAKAMAIYFYGGYTNYTQAHLDALRAAGVHLLGIVVPGNLPPSYATVEADLANYGFDGPVAIDLEAQSFPPAAWVAGIQSAIPSCKWGRYGGSGTLGNYPKLSFDWLSYWPYAAGRWTPVPDLGGWTAWQYAHDVVINGSQYDVSVIDESLFTSSSTPEVDLTPEELARLWNDVETPDESGILGSVGAVRPTGALVIQTLKEVRDLTATVDQLASTVSNLNSTVATLSDNVNNIPTKTLEIPLPSVTPATSLGNVLGQIRGLVIAIKDAVKAPEPAEVEDEGPPTPAPAPAPTPTPAPAPVVPPTVPPSPNLPPGGGSGQP